MTTINTSEYRRMWERARAHHIAKRYEKEKEVLKTLKNAQVVFEPNAYLWAADAAERLHEDLALDPPMGPEEYSRAITWLESGAL